MMDRTLDEKTLHTAADWWTRLRAVDGTDETVEQWLAWTGEDACNLEAFERVTELGSRLGALDDIARRQLIAEFARPAVATPRRWIPLAMAASVMFAFFGGYLAWSQFGASPMPQVYTSAVAHNRDITLPDGTAVALGGASTLTERFSKNERRVELNAGEAFFQVVHNAKRPFVVTAGKLSIRDIGTAFDVRRVGSYVTIAVTQGRVQIAGHDGVPGGDADSTLEAVAGQLVSYDPATSAMSVGTITPEQATAWRNDRLEFVNQPLGLVVADINRYSSRQVHIADAELKALTFTGTIKTGAIDGWLQALPQIFPLQVSESGNDVVLSRAERK
jgi:transmembrane sensor